VTGRDILFHRQGNGDAVTAEELVDGDGVVGRGDDEPFDEVVDDRPQVPDQDVSSYTRKEWKVVVTPALLLVVVIALIFGAWYMLRDTGPDQPLLKDIDEDGTFNLQGHWREDLTVYGTHARGINITLDKGDTLTLAYSSNGPPDGIHVRLQHPLNPTDGANATGGTMVYASSVGGNGTVDLFIDEPGAYQVYFLHPGSTRAPGPGDDPDDHTLAAVAYHLVVVRAHRP